MVEGDGERCGCRCYRPAPLCAECWRPLAPAKARREGEPVYVGFDPCGSHPAAAVLYAQDVDQLGLAAARLLWARIERARVVLSRYGSGELLGAMRAALDGRAWPEAGAPAEVGQRLTDAAGPAELAAAAICAKIESWPAWAAPMLSSGGTGIRRLVLLFKGLTQEERAEVRRFFEDTIEDGDIAF